MNKEEKDQLFSKKVKAGKRTYFFDVRATKGEDYYLTLTESRRIQNGDNFSFEKSKIFIYKEDFAKFEEALKESIEHIKNELLPEVDFEAISRSSNFIPEEKVEIDLKKEELPEDDFGDSELKWE